MILIDKNETLQHPEGGKVCGVFAEGAYLRVRFRLSQSFVDVYLNDMGREVLRISWVLPEKPSAPKPLPEPMAVEAGYPTPAFMSGPEWEEPIKWEDVALL